MEQTIRMMHDRYNINLNKVYCIGFSNGGIFSSLVAQKYGNRLFAGIANIMGGFGKHHTEVELYFGVNPCRILFLTGTKDDYKTSCEVAYDYFVSIGYDCQLKVICDVGHQYIIDEEETIWDFLTQ
jgi:predicted esterase